jgi:hypothetical protein
MTPTRFSGRDEIAATRAGADLLKPEADAGAREVRSLRAPP